MEKIIIKRRISEKGRIKMKVVIMRKKIREMKEKRMKIQK